MLARVQRAASSALAPRRSAGNPSPLALLLTLTAALQAACGAAFLSSGTAAGGQAQGQVRAEAVAHAKAAKAAVSAAGLHNPLEKLKVPAVRKRLNDRITVSVGVPAYRHGEVVKVSP
jgi:hypothetical protein